MEVDSMLGLNYKLQQLEEKGETIYTAIIGAGQMGRGMTSQMILMKGITPSIVVDINIENAKTAFRNAGISEKDIMVAEDQDKVVNG
jgi:predicted homoserine dehydrogenase-like protein